MTEALVVVGTGELGALGVSGTLLVASVVVQVVDEEGTGRSEVVGRAVVVLVQVDEEASGAMVLVGLTTVARVEVQVLDAAGREWSLFTMMKAPGPSAAAAGLLCAAFSLNRDCLGWSTWASS